MASSSKPSRKNGKKTMKLKEWYSELELDLPPPQINRLPSALISMILMKLDPLDILFGAQFVCSSWYEICKDPFMWKHFDKIRINAIYGRADYGDKYRICRHVLLNTGVDFKEIAEHMIDRCCGELIELVIRASYIAYSVNRPYAKLRCLRLSNFDIGCIFGESVWKFPLLTEFKLSECILSKNEIEVIGQSCPLLKSFKYAPLRKYCMCDLGPDVGCYCYLPNLSSDDRALAISANMPALHHLVLAHDPITNVGLQAILDGCSHLVSLDIPRCPNINLDDDLKKRCEQIQDFCGPYEGNESECSEESWRDVECSCRSDMDGNGYSNVCVNDDDDGDYDGDYDGDGGFGPWNYCHSWYIYNEFDEY